MPTSTAITEQDLLHLTGLSRDSLLWLIQALFSGTLWMFGEFMDDDPERIEEEDGTRELKTFSSSGERGRWKDFLAKTVQALFASSAHLHHFTSYVSRRSTGCRDFDTRQKTIVICAQ
ncbi:hypothetical protein BST61_g2010 [Cercospora zeina]